jgi:hypothetical protein
LLLRLETKLEVKIINEKKKFIRAIKGEATLKEETSETKNYDDIWDE